MPAYKLNPKLNELTGEQAFALIAKAREVQAKKGIRVISFGVGQPDFVTFAHIREAAKKALDEGFTGYTETPGIPELRRAIAEYLNERYGAGVNEENVLVTTGAKTAIFLAVAAVSTPGSKVIVADPTYYAYAQVAKLFGARPVYVPLIWEKDRGFRPDVERILKTIDERTAAVVINNPNNPTGTVYNESDVRTLFEEAASKGVALISDEVYEWFVYDGRFFSIAKVDGWLESGILVHSFSKTFSMTGWRLGFLVARKDVVSKLTTLAVNTYSCAPSFVQKAGIVALRGDWSPVHAMIAEFKERRNILYELLKSVPGFEPYLPEGTFYMFPRIRAVLDSLDIDVETFTSMLLEQVGVVVVPGTAFSEEVGKDFVRFSFATSKENIAEGVARIRRFLEEKGVT